MSSNTGSALELNLTPHDLLTEEDMVTLTGVSRPDLQARVLAANNIFFIINANRVPRTTWFHVNNPIHLRTPTLSLSDFGYGFSKSFQPKMDQMPPGDVSRFKLEGSIRRFFSKVFDRLEDEVPQHIKDQISENQKQSDARRETAETLRQTRHED